VKPCDQNILSTLQMAEEMIRLADKGDSEREDVGCGILYGILRDTAFKLKQVAEKEKHSHMRKGWWDKHDPRVGGKAGRQGKRSDRGLEG
jgi:hypothetical protein